jgi:hypothetical protein
MPSASKAIIVKCHPLRKPSASNAISVKYHQYRIDVSIVSSDIFKLLTFQAFL